MTPTDRATSINASTLSNFALKQLLVRAEQGVEPLPSLRGMTIEDCDLSDSAFQKPIDFSGVTFSKAAFFTNVGFHAGVKFTGARFEGIADFTLCRFVEYAYFWHCCFAKTTSFIRSTFEPSEHPLEHVRHPGEANFSYTQFQGDVSFQRARFKGITEFWRTTFRFHADFAEARFDQQVRFSGWPNDVCLPIDQIPEPCRAYLKEKQYIIKCVDNPDTHVNFDLSIRNAAWLRDALEHPEVPHPVAPARKPLLETLVHRRRRHTPVDTQKTLYVFLKTDIDRLVELYRERCETPMFSHTSEVSFRGVTVVTGMSLTKVDLSACRFEGCDIKNCLFEYVDWPEAFTTMRLSRRISLHDEEPVYITPEFLDNEGKLRTDLPIYTEGRSPKSKEGYLSVEHLYRDFRRRAENDGEMDRAQDFYYGELEMRYRSKARPRRWFSLIFLYRYAGGFGKQHGLAAIWLLILIFEAFPLAYCWFAPVRNPNPAHRTRSIVAEAEVRSLEASTLLSQRTHAEGLPGELIYGFERMIVPIQAGLLLLAVRYNFQHQSRD